MLKNIKNRFRIRKKSELKITPGEEVRDAIIKASLEAAYKTGNSTEKVSVAASKAVGLIDGGTALFGGGEVSGALGKIIFKTTRDVARGDTVCVGLCCVSATCESVALACSTIKIIPFRGKIYVGAKIISKGCMAYRNLCAVAGC